MPQIGLSCRGQSLQTYSSKHFLEHLSEGGLNPLFGQAQPNICSKLKASESSDVIWNFFYKYSHKMA